MIYVGDNPSDGVRRHIATLAPEEQAQVCYALPHYWLFLQWMGVPWILRIRFGPEDPVDWSRGIWIEKAAGCGCSVAGKQAYNGLSRALARMWSKFSGAFRWQRHERG